MLKSEQYMTFPGFTLITHDCLGDYVHDIGDIYEGLPLYSLKKRILTFFKELKPFFKIVRLPG